ncbi:hypothetical protein COCSUDRAFT_33963 [Coccomyxa subellipsoidea C-169]|uniref:Uncharacterized protein n=1 Tax=Coccomyxa subellipsoidea (strain C-169) TaxID=574566 RepID=I0YPS4_COCSC|nr:hypothetical protein COCSUDRAFT_33963 [Coccomyxa subellipsoidea C-169]EIE20393.1 hypothetical protein COCSUDRAFT_33963 [Coccomyxa subellipsoidea C-169]|eukprot:XP_005644937.1 hypothetical protein COCSUDRAFT_33963 [Coccomyxa subellipsoidea C-169]
MYKFLQANLLSTHLVMQASALQIPGVSTTLPKEAPKIQSSLQAVRQQAPKQ